MEILNAIESKYKPKGALIIYQNQRADDKTSHYVEYAEIRDKELQPLRPLRNEDLSKLYFFLRTYHTEAVAQLSGFLPKNMVFSNFQLGQYAWTVPGKKRPVYFDKGLKIKDGSIPYPNMLFVVKDESLYIYIYKEAELTARTKLYRAPFLNTYAEGNVCLGNTNMKAIKKATTFEEFIKGWENMYFNSKFSSGAGGKKEFMEAILNKRFFNWLPLIKKFKLKPRKLKSVLR